MSIHRSNKIAGESPLKFKDNILIFFKNIQEAMENPYQFQPFHQAIREPFDFYKWYAMIKSSLLFYGIQPFLYQGQ